MVGVSVLSFIANLDPNPRSYQQSYSRLKQFGQSCSYSLRLLAAMVLILECCMVLGVIDCPRDFGQS